MPTARRTMLLATTASAVLIVTGTVVLVLAPEPPSSFGWFAYAPLSSEQPGAALVVTNWQQVVAVGLVGAGLLIAAALIGYRLGRAHGTADS